MSLYKNGDTCDECNYRTISLLSSFFKIFETIIYTTTITHLNNIWSTDQYGFRKVLRIDNAIDKLTTERLNSTIFCNLNKEFDCVDHDVLLFKLIFYSITGTNYALYGSYLSNRYIRNVMIQTV
jgi:hypothetical protein